ncbi:MAG: molybdopterin-dependent oxidoreductase [Campylobacterota bacterium]|nr:molybdopterin-dependent oxidoreductase [Campylobacterota bacterium]
MQTEISRRRFLQGTAALTVVGVSSAAALMTKQEKKSPFAGYVLEKTEWSEHLQEIPTLCEMCVNKCAAIARVEEGVVTKLNPNPLFPKSKNMLCARGNAGIQALYDPDRLKYPLIRAGERGEGKFKRVTWDEAYEHIKEKMVKIIDEEKDNRSTIGFCAGEGMAEHTYASFMKEKIGSTNFVNHSSICLATTIAGYTLTLGGYGQADLENAEYVIMAGANRAEAIVTPDTMDIFKRTRGGGAKLIVIDPRFTNTAAHADTWLPIEVGTDLAFVLALTYVAITEERYNKRFAEENMSDFEAYKKHIIDHKYTPKWAEKITGIKAAEIYKIARDFMAHAPRSIYYQGRRTAWSQQDYQLRRAQAIFSAMGGGIDKKGGIIFGKKLPLGEHAINSPSYDNAKERIEKEKAAVVGASGSWLAWRNTVIDGTAPYPIRAFFSYKQNPMLSVPNTNKTKAMLEKMDLVVVIDTMPSDTVMMADVVLPESIYLEREDPVKTFGGAEPSIALRKKVVEAKHDTKPVIEIMQGLGEKLSKPLFEISKKYDEALQEEIEERGEKVVYKEDGYDLAEGYRHSQETINHHQVASVYGEEAWKTLREKGVFYPDMDKYFNQKSVNEYQYYPEHKKHYSVIEGDLINEPYHDTCVDTEEIAVLKKDFRTATKKIACALYNLEKKKGIDAMPTWRGELYKPTPKGKFKFITGRHAQFTQSGTANNALLLDLLPENHLWINKHIAEEKGIGLGDKIEVKSSIGSIEITAYPTEKIAENVVFFIHGFGAESNELTLAHHRGVNDNLIIEDSYEKSFGSAAMHETIVEIRRA